MNKKNLIKKCFSLTLTALWTMTTVTLSPSWAASPSDGEPRPHYSEKESATGHLWKLVGTNLDGQEFWEDHDTGFVYGPIISAKVVRDYTQENEIYFDGTTQLNYWEGALRYCQSRNDLLMKWTLPSGVHRLFAKDLRKINKIEKQFNLAIAHGFQSILGIDEENLWSRSTLILEGQVFGLKFHGKDDDVQIGYRDFGNNAAVCVNVE